MPEQPGALNQEGWTVRWGQNPLDGPAVPTADPLSAPRSLWDKREVLVLDGALCSVLCGRAGSEQVCDVLLAQGSPVWA